MEPTRTAAPGQNSLFPRPTEKGGGAPRGSPPGLGGCPVLQGLFPLGLNTATKSRALGNNAISRSSAQILPWRQHR